MLVLTRKQNEVIVIDGHITVKVLRVKGNAIRLGIDAPKSVSVRRGELLPPEAPAEGHLPCFAQAVSADGYGGPPQRGTLCRFDRRNYRSRLPRRFRAPAPRSAAAG